MARGLKGRSAAEIAREIERLQMRFRWAQQLALYALDASYAISLAEKEGSGGFGFVRRQFFYHRNPAVKRAAKLVDSVRQFQPFLASKARWTGRIDADPTPDFQNDSPAKIWHAFQSWNAFMTEMYTDTGEVRKELFWRDEIASTAFTFAQITGVLAGGAGVVSTIRTAGWAAGARAVGTDLAVGAVGYTVFRQGSMALGLQESRDWDWGEFAIGTLTGAGLSAFGRATRIASGRLFERAARIRSGGEQTVTLYRGMRRSEYRQLLDEGVLRSKAETALRPKARSWLQKRLLHPLGSEGSPYVSLTKVPGVAKHVFARGPGRVVAEITVPRSAVSKTLNVYQMEFVAPGGTRVLSVRLAPAAARASWLTRLQWGTEMIGATSIVGGSVGGGVYVIGSAVAD